MKRGLLILTLGLGVLGVGSWVLGQPQPSYNGGALVANTMIRIAGVFLNNKVLFVNTAPSVASGFGTSASVTSNNGSATFRVNVGTGGAASSGVITMPAASTGWNCVAIDTSTNDVTRQTSGTTTSITLTAASAWTASDVLLVSCAGY